LINWYEDKNLIIEFDKLPQVGISYPAPFLTEEENNTIIAKPFYNKEDLAVKICYQGYIYDFKIKGGYRWDGASVPRICWRIIGSNTQPEFIVGSMLHDVLCENHSYIDNNRYLSTIVLEKCLQVAGVGKLRRWAMKHSVDNWQKFCGWSKNDKKNENKSKGH